ncbi:L-galactono-1,4-lactone dehydrogenase, mitochondrial [Mucuna pruriens]|uniref:L-galactono-1,4-lactone dehydrogenase, mitochondrial n=1 Tax=Mucuna pruriens TaxID=157652 RepID=A0A371G2R8_MUCPR|nr:L-galactono-1,4-lactone dehydrogenase, mitochondrial [Mucuna pruriens]
MKDLEYIEELKQLIEKEEIPAPAPIEQCWTASSRSPLSPASSPSEDDIFSWDRYSAYEHWAKIEVPKDKEELAALQARLRKRFPVDAYNKARKELDPNRIVSNNMLEKLFPQLDTI